MWTRRRAGVTSRLCVKSAALRVRKYVLQLAVICDKIILLEVIL